MGSQQDATTSKPVCNPYHIQFNLLNKTCYKSSVLIKRDNTFPEKKYLKNQRVGTTYMSVGLCARAAGDGARVEGEPAIIVHENRTPDTVVVTSCCNILSPNSHNSNELKFLNVASHLHHHVRQLQLLEERPDRAQHMLHSECIPTPL